MLDHPSSYQQTPDYGTASIVTPAEISAWVEVVIALTSNHRRQNPSQHETNGRDENFWRSDKGYYIFVVCFYLVLMTLLVGEVSASAALGSQFGSRQEHSPRAMTSRAATGAAIFALPTVYLLLKIAKWRNYRNDQQSSYNINIPTCTTLPLPEIAGAAALAIYCAAAAALGTVILGATAGMTVLNTMQQTIASTEYGNIVITLILGTSFALRHLNCCCSPPTN